MGWKDLPLWLRGGIWGICLDIIFLLSAIGFSLILSTYYSAGDTIPWYAMAIGYLSGFVGILARKSEIIKFIVPFIVYFVLGSLIGLIIQKIKERNSSQNL